MNRFRSRKKPHGGESRDGSRRPSLETDVPPLPSFSSKTFRRKKSAAPEPKPEVDISAALPPSDDFRTSLLMPNLSARFSMLREQDDPKTKIGKANDDSVLFPKRASRLDLFNTRQGLSDIAEVDSLRGSIRPPFASMRTTSIGSDGYGTDEGSVMSRSRPGEGNTMFGGRQKVYKIPVGGSGSVKNFGPTEDGEVSSGGNMGGKALYESDISMSTFQKLREQEREERDRAAFDFSNLRSSKEQDRPGSPPLGKYNRNRETTSSTNSAPSHPRTSTAATSIASQRSVYGSHEYGSAPSHALSAQPSSASSDRPHNKTRRLYGQGLDQHMYEQQSSALYRLDSLQRARSPAMGASTRTTLQSRSATNLHDRYQRGGPLYASNGFRAASPPPSVTPPRMAEFDLGLDDNSPSPQLSPPISPGLDPNSNESSTLLAALEPNDVGKATASGAFNKPKKPYDESQYLQRQLRLQEGRGTPSPQLIRPTIPRDPSNDEQTGRSRGESVRSSFSRSGSFRNPWMEDRVPRVGSETRLSPEQLISDENSQPAMERSFLSGLNSPDISSAPESESEADPNSPDIDETRFQGFSNPFAQLSKPPQPAEQPDFNHPSTFLASPTDDTTSGHRSYLSEATITQPQIVSAPDLSQDDMDPDSPTLGPMGVPNGLSGLVRAHLRNDSGQSSIYPEDSPGPSGRSRGARESILGHQSALDQQDLQSNGHRPRQVQNHDPIPPPLYLAARNILDQATALKNQDPNTRPVPLGNNKAQRILGDDALRICHESTPSWQEQLRAHHTRGASTETQKEREDLANELAERRRIVQGKLQTFVEADSRSASPAPGARTQDNSPARPTHPFSLLKKTSRGSVVNRPEKPSKAMKMLGIDPNAANLQGSNNFPPDLFAGREQLSDRAMPPNLRKPQPSARLQNDHLGVDAAAPLKQRYPEDPSASERSSQTSSSHSNNSERGIRSRKGSSTVNDWERGRPIGNTPNGSEPQQVNAPSRGADEVAARIARNGERSQSAMSGRFRNNSKPAGPAKFERTAPPGTPFMVNPSKHQGASPHLRSGTSTPALRTNSIASAHPIMLNPQHSSPRQSPNPNTNRFTSGRKHSINKHDISEPKFVSSTSSVDTIDLPPGASLKNGMDSPQTGAAPPTLSREARRTRTQTLLHALGRGDREEASPPMPSESPILQPHEEEQSAFSADDEPMQKSHWQRLRQTTSESGNMNAKARQHAMQAPSPVVPSSVVPSPVVPSPVVLSPTILSPPIPQVPFAQEMPPGAEHVPYQAEHDVPASAVMF